MIDGEPIMGPRKTLPAVDAPSCASPDQAVRTAPDLRNRLDLRAIVLMAILGPCRAIDPYDWPERAAPE